MTQEREWLDHLNRRLCSLFMIQFNDCVGVLNDVATEQCTAYVMPLLLLYANFNLEH